MSEIITNKRKIAVVLFNLGGPDKLESVKPFLFNLFNDKNIITLPKFLRFLIAKFISSRREETAKKIYAHTGNKSPLLDETIKQKEALKKELVGNENIEFEIFICMRHWHPMTDEVVGKVEEYNPHEIVILPLYPQFSTTTTASSLEEFRKKINRKNIKIKTICCYPTEIQFIKAHVNLIEENLIDKDKLDNFRLLFSAHGIPQRIIDNGDPYQFQIEKSVEKIIETLTLNPKFKNVDYKITYQSRVGPLKWLDPNTEDEIKLAGDEGKSLIIVPVAFVSEHVETLVELDIEYKKIADDAGIEYIRIPTLSTNNFFIKSLASMVNKIVCEEKEIITSSEFSKICPDNFVKCLCN